MSCDCHDPSRREFLRVSSAAGFGFFLAHGMARLFADAPSASAKARACILVWLDGGPSHLDTFDPKPGKDTGGPFKAIPTAAPEIQLSEHLPILAKQANRFSLIRGMTSREGNHDRAKYLVHTGYVPQGTVHHPNLGAIVSSETGNPNADLPNYVSLRGAVGGAGFLGVAHAPFVVRDTQKRITNIDPAPGVDDARFRRRLTLMQALEKDFASAHPGPDVEARAQLYDKTVRFMHSPALKAFEVEHEKEPLRQAYGMNDFGQGCLMARRLVEAGVKFVEVVLPGWDTHQDNFTRTQTLMQQLDPGLGTLIDDLAGRGLLESTLILCMGEFGRTPRINENKGRDHYPKTWSVLVGGGGIQGGRVIGKTNDTGTDVVDRPVGVPDLMASVCRSMGINGAKQNHTPQGRPIRIVDEKGAAVSELFA